MEEKFVESILNILSEEIVPAEGCTEPIAIAYTAAKAVQILGKTPERLRVYVSGNMIKNVKSVVVPNTGGMVGIETSAGVGGLLGNPDGELLVISNIDSEKLPMVRKFIEDGGVEVIHVDNDIKLYAKVEAIVGDKSSSVEIKHTHTNITSITKEGEIILDNPCNDGDFNSSLEDRSILSIESIYNFATKVDIKKVEELFDQVISYNTLIANEGLNETYGVNVGATIRKYIKKGFYGDDIRNRAVSLAAAGSDARMNGCPLPVMTTSGSGNQGMTSSLPVISYSKDKDLPYEMMIRGLLLSHLSTIHIKTNVGRLSAYCGVMCASAGVSGAITFLEGGTLKEVEGAINNTLGAVSGVICDGAKSSCAGKISTGLYNAFDSAMIALEGKTYKGGDGIVGNNIEKTIQNVGTLASVGMAGTDKTILKIMTDKN